MRTRSATYYDGRVAFGWTALLPALAMPVFAAFLWYDWSRAPFRPKLDTVSAIVEMGIPLMAAMGAAPLMAVEREERFDELRGSYPEQPSRPAVMRTLGALGLNAISFMVTAVLIRQGYGPFEWRQVIWPAVAPAVFLLGFGLLASGIIGNYWAAAGTALGYWLLEAVTRGTLTYRVFLFDHTWPVEHDMYSLNRWLLAGIGVVMMLANIWWSGRRRKGGTG